MNIISSSIFFVFKNFRFKFFVFKFSRLQSFSPSNFFVFKFWLFQLGSGPFNVPCVEAASLDGFLKEIQRKPRWAGYPIPLGRSRRALECGAGAFDEYYFVFNFSVFNFFVFKNSRFKFFVFKLFRFNIFRFNFSSSIFYGIGYTGTGCFPCVSAFRGKHSGVYSADY